MNTYQPDRPKGRASRPGFTLVELLIVITIIGILAAVALGAIQAARQAARAAKTRATIAKLNEIVLDQYESYQNRRVQPIPRAQLSRRQDLERRLTSIRDLMRLEMPQRWEDVVGLNVNDEQGPLAFYCQVCNGKSGGCSACVEGYYQIAKPALWHVYKGYYDDAVKRNIDNTTLNTYASAECLYLIVSTTNPQAMKMFPDNEIGDVDGDGLKEFVDGWGNPIMFLRWAPGVTDSDVQKVVMTISGNTASSVSDLAIAAVKDDYDPFDPFQVDRSLNQAGIPRSWRLVPYIFSAGPDGIYDICYEMSDSPSSSNELEKITPCKNFGNPYYFSGKKFNRMGAPTTDYVNKSSTAPGALNESLDHYDNIHNHRLQVR